VYYYTKIKEINTNCCIQASSKVKFFESIEAPNKRRC